LNNSEIHSDTLSLISSSSSSSSAAAAASTTTTGIKREISSSQLTTTVLLPPIEMSLEEQRALGYMPFRDDFEREYKNNAETLLSNLTIANNQISLLSSLISSSSNKETSSSHSGNMLTTASASKSLADLYFRTILNYTDIFPEFIPLFIDFATNANIILSHKFLEISDHKNMAGCILDNSQENIPDNFANTEHKIFFFKKESEFIKIFANYILE
jgi:hypothetical protein